jgi:hypothetical protein
MSCSLCGSESFRTSRLRSSDISRILVFLYPVRCAECFQRQFVNIFRAMKVRRQSKNQNGGELRHRTTVHSKPNRA